LPVHALLGDPAAQHRRVVEVEVFQMIGVEHLVWSRLSRSICSRV